MERVIQHARSRDGVRVGYWTIGTGKPLVYLAGGPWNHIEIWDVPECRAWYERLAQNRRLVRYDVRGTGSSDRKISDFSLDALVGDLEAVVDALGLEEFDLFAAGDAGPVAISFGLRNHERVSRCILWCAWAQGTDFETSPRIQAWRGLIDDDWQLMVETCAHLAFGWDAGNFGRQAAESFHASITRETAQAALEAMVTVDVRDSLQHFTIPTLVLHRGGVSWLPVSVAHKISDAMPNSRLTLVEGESTAPYLGNTDALAAAINKFLGPGGLEAAEAIIPDLQTDSPRAEPLQIRDASWLRPQRVAGVVEILPVYLNEGNIFFQHPHGARSWQVDFETATHPGDVAGAALDQLNASPTSVHSTSWRVQEAGLVLTYVAVLPEPIDSTHQFQALEVQTRDLARGTATDAPPMIDVAEVVEHALRHLSWLVRDDEPIRDALGTEWQSALALYQPEPFSAFDISGALSQEDGCLLCTRYSRSLSQFVERPG